MTMDHGTCNIDVGCSINIQRTDGECGNTTQLLLHAPSARCSSPTRSLAPPLPRSRVDSFISPRISVHPLLFVPRPAPNRLVLHRLRFTISPVSSRRTVRAPCFSPLVSSSLFLSPLPHYSSFTRFRHFSSFPIPLLAILSPCLSSPSLTRPPFVRPRFSAIVCHVVGGAARPTRDDHAWAPDRSFDQPDRPASEPAYPYTGNFVHDLSSAVHASSPLRAVFVPPPFSSLGISLAAPIFLRSFVRSLKRGVLINDYCSMISEGIRRFLD